MRIISACHDGIPSACGHHALLSFHGHDGGGGVRHVHDDLCGHDGLRRSDAYHDGHVCHGDPRDGRNDDDHPSCGVHRVFHDVRDGDRACGACLHGGGRHGSDDPCGSDPCGAFCGIHQHVRPYRDVHDDHVSRPYGDGHAHGVLHDDRVHPNVSYDHHHVRGDDPRGGACRGGLRDLYDDGDVLYVPYVLCRRGHGGDVHDDGGRRHARACWPPRRDPRPLPR